MYKLFRYAMILFVGIFLLGCGNRQITDSAGAAGSRKQTVESSLSDGTATADAETNLTDADAAENSAAGDKANAEANAEGNAADTVTDTAADTATERKDNVPPLIVITDEEETTQTAEETVGETPAETEPEDPILKSLSGIAPGTVIPAEKINFDDISQYFSVWKIEEGDNLYARMNGKSYRRNNHIDISELRYIKLPHYNFDGEIQVGELVVNQSVVDDVIGIFEELFQNHYQIQSMYLIDNYWTGDGDSTDSASIDVNNTSAFCYREVTGGGSVSRHGYGKAIDINPQQNPYVSYKSGKPSWSHKNADDYIDRDTGLPHVITHDDLAYKVFAKHGFTWGGDWNTIKDYQHFQKD